MCGAWSRRFNIPVLICDGYEADDIIGTLVRRAEKEGFQSYMVTSGQGLRPARHAEHLHLQALAQRRGGGDHRPAGDSEPLGRAAPGAGGGCAGADGRRVGQHPRRAGHRREDGHEAHRPIWHAGQPAGPRGRIDRPGEANPGNQPRAGAAVQAAGDHHLRRALPGRVGRAEGAAAG